MGKADATKAPQVAKPRKTVVPRPPEPPKRVFVPYGSKPPRGVLWVSDSALLYHAQRAYESRSLGPVAAQPARMEEFRERIQAYVRGRHDDWWDYYRGRNLACPYRCPLGSATCPVDVLVNELNKPRPPRAAALPRDLQEARGDGL